MPKVVDHAARRDAIADACFELFARQGYAGVSLKDMARAAGVSIGTIYHYFPEKAAVLDHMFRRVATADVAAARELISVGDGSPASRLSAVGRFLQTRRDHLRRVLQIALEVHRHEPSGSAHAQVTDALTAYRAVLGEAVGLPDGPVLRSAFALAVGVLVQGILDRDAHDLTEELTLLAPLWPAVAHLDRASRGEG